TAERNVFFAGILLGISIGIRLSFALLPLPFIFIIYKNPLCRSLKEKLILISLFFLGLLTAMLPAAILFYFSKESFIFGNFIYPGLNTLYRQESGYMNAMTIIGKFQYLKDLFLQPGNFYLLLTLAVFLPSAFIIKNSKFHYKSEILSVLVFLPFLLAGSFAATPSWYQYYYPLMPFLLLACLYSMKTLFTVTRNRTIVLLVFFFMLFQTNLHAKFSIFNIVTEVKTAISNSSWQTMLIRAQSQEIRRITKKTKILTLAPVYSLEADNQIYKEFATGPFAFRVSHLINKEQRNKFNIISREELPDLLEQDQPKAILVGFEGYLEQEFINYAQANNYRKIILSSGKVLYLP
ncbi:MAG: hypothetical protein JW867_02535, partial [Candidatus Omnitrophica bacterium]|nr:hypothetical protein [Candidatus Omnitrophota bacterium]